MLQRIKISTSKILSPENGKPEARFLLVCTILFILNIVSTVLQINNTFHNVKNIGRAIAFLAVSLTVQWLIFITLAAVAFTAMGIFGALNNTASKLRIIMEHEHYSSRIDEQATCALVGSIVEESNRLLSTIEQKNQRVEEMGGIIDQREQENQLLWLEIEHNLCLAKEEAERDGLTGLYNRKSIEERFALELEKAVQQNYPLSVLMADLDHFKQVNDTYGHKTGDEVLKIFAETLRKTTRSNDVPARYGGEEFIIVLPETPIEYALNVAKRINSEFSKSVEQELGEAVPGLSCTVSIGVADFPICAKDKSKLVSAADLALYKAKENGRNCVIYYGDIHNMKKPA